jgi:cysteine-rich repeat protein
MREQSIRSSHRFPLAIAFLLAAGCGDSGSTTGSGSSTSSTTSSTSGSGGAMCGDGTIEGTEECDDGNNTSNDGCNNDCSFTCIAGNPGRDHCDDGNPCNGTETCGADHACAAGTPLTDGDACGAGKICVQGNCVLPSCGDGVVEAPEECDDGNAASGDGCEPDCKFTCLSTDATRNCSSTSPCVANGTCNDTTHVCTPGSNVMNGTPCGPNETCQGGICTTTNCAVSPACTACSGGFCSAAGMCAPSTCGDGCLDLSAGEQCDPPNGAACSATCQVPQVCGDGFLSPGEDCDDGNLFNLDGCDSNCHYEVITRMTSLVIQGIAAPAMCTPSTNRLGTQSLTTTALAQLNSQIQLGVDNGQTNILTQMLGLDDLTGVSDSMFQIGVVSAALDPARGAWPGTPPPLDWWFLADPVTVDQLGLPKGILDGAVLSARNLTGGPSDITLNVLLGSAPAPLEMTSTRVAATFNGSPAPNTPAPPPSQLTAGLSVFRTVTGSGTGQGLCGNVTVESLASIPAPEALTQGGSTACGMCQDSRQYVFCGAGMPVGPNCNSLLDILVGGCKVVACIATAVVPQEPDVPATMGGTVQNLNLGIGNKVPASMTTGNRDAYSAYMKFDANRAHITGETCSTTPECQIGQSCIGGVCK